MLTSARVRRQSSDGSAGRFQYLGNTANTHLMDSWSVVTTKLGEGCHILRRRQIHGERTRGVAWG